MNDSALVSGRFTIAHQRRRLSSSSHADICGEENRSLTTTCADEATRGADAATGIAVSVAVATGRGESSPKARVWYLVRR